MAMQHLDSANLRQSSFDPYDLGAAMVSDVMSGEAISVRDDARVDAIRALFLERAISGAPVVDARGKVVGVVALSDLVRHEVDGDEADDVATARRLSVRTRQGYRYDLPAGFHEDSVTTATAADVMTPFAFVLPPDASVAQAAALMAYERIQRVVIASDGGTALGMITALDVTTFLAKRLGLMPPHAMGPAGVSRAGLLTRESGLSNVPLHPSIARATVPPPRESGRFPVRPRRDVA